MQSNVTGAGDFIEDCRQILIICREKAALTSYEMARAIQMIPTDYIIAERTGKGLKISHITKAARLVGLKVTLKFIPKEGNPMAPLDDIHLT